MATSTPAPPDGGASTDPSPRQETLATVAAQVAAIDTLIGLAQHSIRVFDVDLSGMGWNDAARAESIAAFLRARPTARLEIIVHDTGWIERSCPRLTESAEDTTVTRSRSRRTGEDAKHAMDPLLIVDGVAFPAPVSRRAAARRARRSETPSRPQPLVTRFDAISESAEPGFTATVLGLLTGVRRGFAALHNPFEFQWIICYTLTFGRCSSRSLRSRPPIQERFFRP